MSLFKNSWFRWFASAFCFGVAVVPVAVVPVAVAVCDFKDPKVKVERFDFNGNSAWVLMALNLGIVSGALGLGVAAFKGLGNKSA